ncbi:hypothetical protein Btru_052391, partial [Bulinus truncatus]
TSTVSQDLSVYQSQISGTSSTLQKLDNIGPVQPNKTSTFPAVHHTSTLNNSTITDVENCSTLKTSSIPAVEIHHQFYQQTQKQTVLLQDSRNSTMLSMPAQRDSIPTSNSAPVNQQNVNTEQLSAADILSPELIAGNLSDECSSISRCSFSELLNFPLEQFKQLLTSEEEEEANFQVSDMSGYSSSSEYPYFLLSPTQ